jgi:hypothetical protein
MARAYVESTIVKGAFLQRGKASSGAGSRVVFSNTSPPVEVIDLLPPEAIARDKDGKLAACGPLGTFTIEVTFVPQGAVARGDTVALQPVGTITPLHPRDERQPTPRSEQPLDPVQRAAHYNQHPSGLECRDIVRDLPFALGNLVKYLWRWEQKGSPVQDLQKAYWYLSEEFARARALGEIYDARRPRKFSYVRDEILRGDTFVLGTLRLDDYVLRLMSLLGQVPADDTSPPDPLSAWADTFSHCLVSAATGDPRPHMGGEHMFQATEHAIVAQLRARGATP